MSHFRKLVGHIIPTSLRLLIPGPEANSSGQTLEKSWPQGSTMNSRTEFEKETDLHGGQSLTDLSTKVLRDEGFWGLQEGIMIPQNPCWVISTLFSLFMQFYSGLLQSVYFKQGCQCQTLNSQGKSSSLVLPRNRVLRRMSRHCMLWLLHPCRPPRARAKLAARGRTTHSQATEGLLRDTQLAGPAGRPGVMEELPTICPFPHYFLQKGRT